MNNKEKVAYLCAMIISGVDENDRDSVRSHLEDLNGFLTENNLVGE